MSINCFGVVGDASQGDQRSSDRVAAPFGVYAVLRNRIPQLPLYESGVRARVMPEPLAQTLSVLVQLYSYLALAVRFPASIVELTGLSAPVF